MDPDAPHGEDFYISYDKKLIDPAFVIKAITTSYWGGWRTPIVILKSMDHSICIGVYKHLVPDQTKETQAPDRMVGFARVVTDYTTFAWICDVIIDPEFRHQGLGKFLMSGVMRHPDVEPRACLLATKDAHGLYRKFGFELNDTMKRLPHPKAG